MFKTFQIPRPSKETPQEDQRAWAYMQQQLELKPFVPALTGFTGTEPTVKRGYFQLLGPVVFVKILLQSEAAFGWDQYATIDLPHPPFVASNGTLYPQYFSPIVDTSTSLAVNDENPRVEYGALGIGQIKLYTSLSSTGGPTEVALSGWYLRNAVPVRSLFQQG